MNTNSLTTYILSLSKNNTFSYDVVNPVPKLPKPSNYSEKLSELLYEIRTVAQNEYQDGLKDYVMDTDLVKFAPDDYEGMKKSQKLDSLFTELKEQLLPNQKNGHIAIKFDPKDFIKVMVQR